MKKFRSVKVFLLCITLAICTVLSGCSKGASSQTKLSSKDAVSKELEKGNVKLVMYLAGDPQKDQQKVYDKINEKMKKDINTTVTIKNLPWSDLQTKYQLVFASGEEFDCAFAGTFCNYASLANKNAFMPITEDMIKTYAPNTWKDMDASFLKGSRINGKLYMVPANQHDVRGSVVGLRGDLIKKYNIPKVTNLDTYYNYLTTIAKNEKNIIAFSNDPTNSSWYDETYGRYNAITKIDVYGNDINQFDAHPKVFNEFTTDTFLKYALKMRELNKAGVFPKDILSSKNNCTDMFKAGTCASELGVYNSMYEDQVSINKSNPSWDIQVADITNYNVPLSDLSPTDSGLVINPQSKHAERVLMMLDLLRENRSYHDLTYGGIEGLHYTLTSDGKYKETSYGTKAFAYNSNCPWAWGTDKTTRINSEIPQTELDVKAKWLKQKKTSVTAAFIFDNTNVKSEETAVNNTLTKYMNILLYGFSDNPKATIDKMNAELKSDGLDSIQQETQKQLDKFVAQYNK